MKTRLGQHPGGPVGSQIIDGAQVRIHDLELTIALVPEQTGRSAEFIGSSMKTQNALIEGKGLKSSNRRPVRTRRIRTGESVVIGLTTV